MTTTPTSRSADTPFLPYPLGEGSSVVAAGEHAGLQYAVIKIESGVGTSYYSHWANGYVLLPEGHRWLGLDLQGEDSDKGPSVHGGITYGPEADGWIGFDYNHGCDSWAGSRLGRLNYGAVPRTIDEVHAECLNLCEQAGAS